MTGNDSYHSKKVSWTLRCTLLTSMAVAALSGSSLQVLAQTEASSISVSGNEKPRTVAAESEPQIRLRGTKEELHAGAQVDDLSSEILKAEIDLFRLTTLFRLNNPRETPLHRFYVAATSTLAYSVADAGNIVTFTNAYRYHYRPQNFSVGRAEAGPFLIFLGELGFVTRTVGGATLDLVHSQSVKHRGFDRTTFEHKANQLQTQIQDLLGKRKNMIASSSVQTNAQEQAVLQDIADCASAEFVANYARATRLKAFRLGDNITKNFTSGTGAFWGGLLEYLAAVHSLPKTAGPAGIGFIVSGAGFIGTDGVAYWGGKIAEKRSKTKLQSKSHPTQDSEQQLARDAKSLKVAASGAGSTTMDKRLSAYDSIAACISQHRAISANEEKEMWNRYLHDQIINAVEGGANIGAGSVLASAGYSFHNNPNPLIQFKNSDQFLENFGTSALVFTPTASAGMIDTPAEALYGHYRSKRDTVKGLNPSVALNDRLQTLDQIEKKL